MGKELRVVLDAMGGDNAPASTVEGAVLAVRQNPDVTVILCGQTEPVRAEMNFARSESCMRSWPVLWPLAGPNRPRLCVYA